MCKIHVFHYNLIRNSITWLLSSDVCCVFHRWKPPGSQDSSLQTIASDGLRADMEEQEQAEKERKVETDDPELLAQQRNWDEYKDTHRTGWGNRMNRS